MTIWAAMAASTALPPLRRTSRPASVASLCEATMTCLRGSVSAVAIPDEDGRDQQRIAHQARER
jgi:hypothetical protein